MKRLYEKKYRDEQQGKIVFKPMESKIKLLMDKVYKEFEIFHPDILLENEQAQNFIEMNDSARIILKKSVERIYPGHGEPLEASSIRMD